MPTVIGKKESVLCQAEAGTPCSDTRCVWLIVLLLCWRFGVDVLLTLSVILYSQSEWFVGGSYTKWDKPLSGQRFTAVSERSFASQRPIVIPNGVVGFVELLLGTGFYLCLRPTGGQASGVAIVSERNTGALGRPRPPQCHWTSPESLNCNI